MDQRDGERNDALQNGSHVGHQGSEAPTTDALRVAIDRGEASDRFSYPDPAASPLGTDDEAGGHPPDADQRRAAARIEIGGRPARQSQPAIPARSVSNPALPLALVAVLLFLALASLAFTWAS